MSKTYGSQRALNNVSLQVPPGAIGLLVVLFMIEALSLLIKYI